MVLTQRVVLIRCFAVQVEAASNLQAHAVHAHPVPTPPGKLQPSMQSMQQRQQYLAPQVQAALEGPGQQYHQLAPASFLAQPVTDQQHSQALHAAQHLQALHAAQHQLNSHSHTRLQGVPDNAGGSSAYFTVPPSVLQQQQLLQQRQLQQYAELYQRQHESQQRQLQALQQLQHNLLHQPLAVVQPFYGSLAQPQVNGFQSMSPAQQLQAYMQAGLPQQLPAPPAAPMPQPVFAAAAIPAGVQPGMQLQPAQDNQAAIAEQQQLAVPLQQPACHQPGFFAAVWDSMRAAASALGQGAPPAVAPTMQAQIPMQPSVQPSAHMARAVKAEPRTVKAEPSAVAVSLTAQQPGAYLAQLQAPAAVKAEAPNGICSNFSKPGPSRRDNANDEDGFVGGVEGVQDVEEEAALEVNYCFLFLDLYKEGWLCTTSHACRSQGHVRALAHMCD